MYYYAWQFTESYGQTEIEISQVDFICALANLRMGFQTE